MNSRNMFSVAGIAVTSMVVTLFIASPLLLDANDNETAVPATVATPTLEVEQAQLTLESDEESYSVGDAPQLTLTASNPTDQPLTTSVWVGVSAAAPTSPMSRVISVPQSLWRQESQIVLAPGETKELSIRPDVVLPEGMNVTFNLATQEDLLLVMPFAVQSRGLNVDAIPQSSLAANSLNESNTAASKIEGE